LSGAEMALPPKTASIPGMITIIQDGIFVMTHSFDGVCE
jgi:hypothetical protein